GAAVSGGIALQMTECDVVRRAGPVEKIDIGSDERGERAVTLTYLRGPWPGGYRFAGGRLVSIERGPGPPPAPAKPQEGTAEKPRRHVIELEISEVKCENAIGGPVAAS